MVAMEVGGTKCEDVAMEVGKRGVGEGLVWWWKLERVEWCGSVRWRWGECGER